MTRVSYCLPSQSVCPSALQQTRRLSDTPAAARILQLPHALPQVKPVVPPLVLRAGTAPEARSEEVVTQFSWTLQPVGRQGLKSSLTKEVPAVTLDAVPRKTSARLGSWSGSVEELSKWTVESEVSVVPEENMDFDATHDFLIETLADDNFAEWNDVEFHDAPASGTSFCISMMCCECPALSEEELAEWDEHLALTAESETDEARTPSGASSSCSSRASVGGTRRVWFNLDMNEACPVTPYSEVYGMHPRDFHFDGEGHKSVITQSYAQVSPSSTLTPRVTLRAYSRQLVQFIQGDAIEEGLCASSIK